MMSDLKKLDSFTLETSQNHLIRIFLRNGRLRVKSKVKNYFCTYLKNLILPKIQKKKFVAKDASILNHFLNVSELEIVQKWL